jgi:hypothetical protein
MMRPAAALVALGLCLAAGAPAFADDPPDMVAAAKARADDAPRSLTRRTLGEVALPTYGTAKFRDVRAFYIRQQLINDQVIFCGELDAVIPGTKKRSGWTKFIYIPGDPTTLMTDTPGLGTREIGPQVRKRMCDDTPQKWLSGDYTAAFSKMPPSLAEAEKAE